MAAVRLHFRFVPKFIADYKICYNCVPLISGSLSPRHGARSDCGWRNGLQYGGWLGIYWISSSAQPTRGGPLAWGLG